MIDRKETKEEKEKTKGRLHQTWLEHKKNNLFDG